MKMETMINLTNLQARRFMLLKQGLLGEHKFAGKQGALDFIRQAGCVQFDPVDVCGRSADIVLNSRVRGYKKDMLDELLYKDRSLIDFFDKNLSIFPVEDVPALFNSKTSGAYAEAYYNRGGDELKQIEPLIRRLIEERGHISAKEIDVDQTIMWYWSVPTSLPRVALESMYFSGELIIHHKTGTNKSYAFTKDHIPVDILDADPPFNTNEERLAWHVERRIGAVGLLWNRSSDAWLGLSMKTAGRAAAFGKLVGDGAIIGVAVEGLSDVLYCRAGDMPLIEAALQDPVSGAELDTEPGAMLKAGLQPNMGLRPNTGLRPKTGIQPRCEFIAPLDSFIWDRKLIKALFGFEYTWEIYTPAVKRKYGGYVLPVLYGEKFIGRIETVCDRKTKTLVVKNIWYEDGVRQTKQLRKEVEKCLKRFAGFNDCDEIRWGL